MKILIAEDVKSTRMVLRRMIEKMPGDWEIIEAEDGERALELYFQLAPEIIFLDVQLPKVNGWGLLSFVRRSDAETQIVMVTASKESEDVQKAADLGASGFVGKPFDQDELREFLGNNGVLAEAS